MCNFCNFKTDLIELLKKHSVCPAGKETVTADIVTQHIFDAMEESGNIPKVAEVVDIVLHEKQSSEVFKLIEAGLSDQALVLALEYDRINKLVEKEKNEKLH